MFLLPSNDGQSLPIDVPESGQVWESLLRLCYPEDDPSFRNIDAIANVIAASIKYEFRYAIKFMRKELRRYIPSNALDVFAIAYRLDFLEEAREAASSLHPKNPSRAPPVKPVSPPPFAFGIGGPRAPTQPSTCIEWPSTLEGKTFSPKIQSLLSAGDLFRLLKYLRTDSYPNFRFWDPVPPKKTVPQPTLDLGFDTGDADLILKSTDDVEFRVHKLIIFLASANHLCNASFEFDADTLPVIRLSENSATLGTLVSMCYPIQAIDFEDISVVNVLKAAMKFEMKKIVETLRIRLTHDIEKDPLRVYFTSIALGLKEEAVKASKVFALLSGQYSANSYRREMEDVPAIAYHRLLKYRYQCRVVAAKKWDDCHPHRSHSGDILVGTVALPLVEREWEANRKVISTSFLIPSALMEESNRKLREIKDLQAKVELELDPDIFR